MPFIPPMLCSRLESPARPADLRYIAEPKLDGQRAQVHIRLGQPNATLAQPLGKLPATSASNEPPRRRGIGRARYLSLASAGTCVCLSQLSISAIIDPAVRLTSDVGDLTDARVMCWCGLAFPN